MKKRDYNLVKDGKYNRLAIMQLAWAYMRQNKHLSFYTFRSALRNAWVDARLKMDEFKAQLNPTNHFVKKDLRQILTDLNPSLRYYDSSWR